ncbi:bifunctional 2-polyprenyl-6-hydroxyphenol methylase/3-demethylubiquinol 3-O-methyltransferase UbiG [Helicobacter sp. MIT 14-3879]|uniref:class I SAM-dependent methyltransferase n=1 Tax=Helicobacter sp. MIT 14-3879 TaxID=2040649 RepID=UPI000E1E2C87|nr:class I SAM-dependent methyltransferase [Helicobacter sp. MIT 14-3879]RDU65029.1 hypothetical protein CQA44_01585 [Helicobacter sp. MIT 14-3879]
MDTKTLKEIWERKAQTFPRLRNDCSDSIEILEFFKENGVIFNNKSIIDIGCGNGRFSFNLAKFAKKVTAIDISSLMLKNLIEDSKILNLNNITCIQSSWEDFEIKENFDIAFASMTPALNNKEGFIKALSICNEYFCYIGWGRFRKCEFLEEIMKLHNIKLELPVGLPNVLIWLNELGYSNIKVCYKNSDFIYKEDKAKTFDNIKWHINAHNTIANDELINLHIQKYSVNGEISYKHSREIGIALIKK